MNQRIIERLRNVTILHGLSTDELGVLSATLHPVAYKKEEKIVGKDDVGDSLYIIDEGRVKVALNSDNGREMILTIFRPGDFFGEMSLLDGQPRSASVIAMEDSQLLRLDRKDFVQHLKESPHTALNILAEMSLRLRHADHIIGNLALLDVYGRSARVLLDLAKSDGEASDEGIIIKSRPTQQDLAAMIGTSRETVSRVLSEFQKRGFLWMNGRQLILSHGFSECDVTP